MRMDLLVFFLFCSFSFLVVDSAQVSSKIGVNYGRLGNNLPSPYESIQLLKTMKAGWVKLYDADAEVLKLLSGTGLCVSVMVQNHEIIDIALSQTIADQWVQNNVMSYYPATMIRFVLVGNEVLSFSSDQDQVIWRHLVPAMRRIKNSIRGRGVQNVKVGTPLAMDILQSTFPPSAGMFRPDIAETVMVPLLQLLNGTKSFFFIDAYPYYPWSANPTETDLDFALFRANRRYTDPGSGLTYTNLLDQMLDSVVFAMAKLGYPNIQLAISETGWPNSGDIDQVGANVQNAATYNRNLIRRMTANPPLGTPARPGRVIPTFIFSLFDENLKGGAGTERHWGLMNPNGTHIYGVDLTGKRSASEYEPLPEASNDVPYVGKLWCVVARGANLTELGPSLVYACSQGKETCTALMPGRECYEPVSMAWHASYAFSSYWSQFRSQGAICYFNGLAEQTTTDPSSEQCQFPSVTLRG